jgi:hypothetical protein
VSDVAVAFEKVLGRQSTEEERARLYRLRDALGLGDNDALWLVVLALEHYDAQFRVYPERLADMTEKSIEGARAAFAVAAQSEAAHVQQLLAEQVAASSVEIARKLAERPVGLHRVTMVLAAVVAFGALCVHAGYDLATTSRPFWVARGGGKEGLTTALSVALSVPAGWMVFALLLPTAMYGVRMGWVAAHDALAERRERALGWCIVGLCVVGCVACGVAVAKLT